MEIAEKKTSLLAIAAAWSIVAIPLTWGVYQSVIKSLPLFQPPVAAKSTTPLSNK